MRLEGGVGCIPTDTRSVAACGYCRFMSSREKRRWKGSSISWIYLVSAISGYAFRRE